MALWAWDIVVDNCAICRNHIMDLCEHILQYTSLVVQANLQRHRVSGKSGISCKRRMYGGLGYLQCMILSLLNYDPTDGRLTDSTLFISIASLAGSRRDKCALWTTRIGNSKSMGGRGIGWYVDAHEDLGRETSCKKSTLAFLPSVSQPSPSGHSRARG